MSGNREALEAASEKNMELYGDRARARAPLSSRRLLSAQPADGSAHSKHRHGRKHGRLPAALSHAGLSSGSALTQAHLLSPLFALHLPPCLSRAGEARAREDWDIAADIAVEYLADSLDEDILRETESDTRRAWYERFLTESRIMTAERIYRSLQGMA